MTMCNVKETEKMTPQRLNGLPQIYGSVVRRLLTDLPSTMSMCDSAVVYQCETHGAHHNNDSSSNKS